MPRRVYTYSPEMGWSGLNLTATLGAGVLFVAMVVFLVNVLRSLRGGARAGDNPWRAETLEWATSSPPPLYNFARLPVVHDRSPLWRGGLGAVTGLPADKRRVLVTHPFDASPTHHEEIPGPSTIPLISSAILSAGLIGSVFSMWWLVVGALLTIPAAIYWYFTEERP
jgi:cytochrome c oxidase subunit 1